MKNKYYVVWKGRTPGIYDNWEACKKEVEGFQGALYKGFPDRASAEAAYAQGFAGFEKTENGERKTENKDLSVFRFPLSSLWMPPVRVTRARWSTKESMWCWARNPSRQW